MQHKEKIDDTTETSKNDIDQKIKRTTVIRILILMLLFYICIFVAWNITNSKDQNKPSGILWDTRQEGYKEDPLHDRYNTEKDK